MNRFQCSRCLWTVQDWRKLISHRFAAHGLLLTPTALSDWPCEDGIHYYHSYVQEGDTEFKCSCGRFVAIIISERTEEA